MLKDLYRSEIKECLILLGLAFLLREYLTIFTIGFLALGTLLVATRRRPGKKVRNSLALVIFASYWWSYGKVIDPEVGLNFLTTVTVLKLMEKETLRDRFMVFFGLLLIISAGSLFERTLSYVLFFSFSFFLLIQDFYQNIGARWKIKELLIALAWVLPLTFLLFFLSPRSMNPLAFQSGSPVKGEIGYTTNVDISNVESLSVNTNPVFEVKLSETISHDKLYWRGNSLSFTDGWNWILLNKAWPNKFIEKQPPIQVSEVKQSFRSISREDFLFSLDHPMRITVGGLTHQMDNVKGMPQSKQAYAVRYEVISSLIEGYESIGEDLAFYTRAPIKPDQRVWINENFKGTTPEQVIQEVREYFVKFGFTYSLSPGRVANFKEFMQEKKIGFCSHYASALGLILRAKKMPARLVSGFMGGNYNRFADFYLISQNDAHVWVEVFFNSKWNRVDPTGWIAPTRLDLGGEAYMNNQAQNKSFNFLSKFGWYYDARMWLGQWDYLFYQWLEEADYHQQENWIKKFNLKREWVYGFAIILIVFFMLLYAWSLNKEASRGKSSLTLVMWQEFLEKTKARGLDIPAVSIHEGRTLLEEFHHSDQELLLNLWDELVDLSFMSESNNGLKEMAKRIRKL